MAGTKNKLVNNQKFRTGQVWLLWSASLLLCWVLPFELAWGFGIQRASTDARGAEGNSQSNISAITSNGRYVVFESEASNLVEGDSNGRTDIFLKDLKTGKVRRVSTGTLEEEGDSDSWWSSITPNGRYVVFVSNASNLVFGDNNDTTDIFRKDLKTGKILRVSTDAQGVEGNSDSWWPVMTPNGRYVVFGSAAKNLVPGDSNDTYDIFRKDLKTGKVLRVSTNAQGVEGNSDSWWSAVTPNGRYIVFGSAASNLVPGDSNGSYDIFRKDLKTGKILRVSTDEKGVEGNSDSEWSAITRNSRYVFFGSVASNLVPDDSNDSYDIFRKDLKTGKVLRVSTDAQGEEGNAESYEPAITPNGRYVAFGSDASNLVAGDNNDAQDIFRKDIKTGKIRRVSTDSEGVGGDSGSWWSAITPNGRFVVFGSAATNLVPGDSNGSYDIFRYDFKGKP